MCNDFLARLIKLFNTQFVHLACTIGSYGLVRPMVKTHETRIVPLFYSSIGYFNNILTAELEMSLILYFKNLVKEWKQGETTSLALCKGNKSAHQHL